MRKVMKVKKMLAVLLVLAVLLCSFPVVYAEDISEEIHAEEITAETTQAAEETAPAEQEPETEPEPAPMPEPVPDAAPAPAATEEKPVEPADAPAPAAKEEKPAAESEPEKPAAEPATAGIPEKKPAAEPGAAGVPEKEAEGDTEEDTEPEKEETLPENAEDELYEFDDDDAGHVSEALLEQYNCPETEQEAVFNGAVEIAVKDGGIAFGQDVTLVANVSGAETLSYRLVWEANDGDDRGWYTVGSGREYTFTLTNENAYREYRVAVFTVD